MKSYFPGTVIERNGQNAEEFLLGIFSFTKGLMLAQVKEITGLDAPAIQNWINRGWVRKPVDKRYDADQLSRIMIINMLRDVMKLEHIAALLAYFSDTNDAPVVTDAQLYCYLCKILDTVDFETILSQEELQDKIERVTGDETGRDAGYRRKLIDGMEIILTYYASCIIKKQADRLYRRILKEGE